MCTFVVGSPGLPMQYRKCDIGQILLHKLVQVHIFGISILEFLAQQNGRLLNCLIALLKLLQLPL